VEGVDWSDVAQNKDMWQALVYPVMHFPVPQNVGNFLTTEELLASHVG